MRDFARPCLFATLVLAGPVGAHAATARETLIQTAFTERDRTAALAQIASAEATATAMLGRSPTDVEALMTRAMATSYRAKLTHSRTDALSAKAQFEALVAHYPHDAEAQVALGAWHLSAVKSLGALMARGGLGARKAAGLEAIDRALAFGGGHALFPGLAGLLRLSIDPKDARGIALIGEATHAPAPTALDRLMQRRAALLESTVKGGDAKLIQALADRLLPLGQFR